jgi:hypothetical protein
MAVRRTPQYELTIEDLDRELIARGVQFPHEELFKFEDSKGTPARDEIMARVKDFYDKATAPNPALALISTDALVKTLIHKTRQIEEYRTRGIWYEDHRMDYFGITDERVKRNVNCVAAIIWKKDLIDEENGFSSIKVKNFGKSFNLYEGEAFRDQPVAAGQVCTGFLVKKDIIATAGHTVGVSNVTDLRFVFGFKMLDPYTAVTQVSNENIYKGVKIVNRVYSREINMGDWALVRLDREVENQQVANLSNDEVKLDQPVYVIGHPAGLPVKYAPGAKVLGFKDAFFAADLDTYMGNSGSPVFNADTHEVIGIVVQGYTRDFRWTGKGWASVIYPRRGITSKGPQCTMVSQFKDLVDNL